MRNALALVVLVALIGACSPEEAADVTSTSSTTTTTAPSTTTTIDPAAVIDATCDRLKIAAFDLQAAIAGELRDLGLDESSELAETEVGRIVVTALVDFYDEVGTIAGDAPDEVADDLGTIAAGVDPWRNALDSGAADLESTLEELDPASLRTPATDLAIDELRVWTEEECGAPIPLDVEEVVFTTVFSAMVGGLGSVFEEMGGDLLDLYDGETVAEDDGSFAVAYGDDPESDALFDQCGAGDGVACRDLYFSAYGEYELWGQTCGGTIPLRPAFLVDCEGKFTSTATVYGDDFVFDTLWDECEAGEAESCDGLYAAAPFGSAYESFGAGCAGTREAGESTRPCAFVVSGEPFAYGDDPTFDQLWAGCSLGDSDVCYDLFLQTPINSAYEAFGRVCGDLSEVGASCEGPAAWLGGPVG